MSICQHGADEPGDRCRRANGEAGATEDQEVREELYRERTERKPDDGAGRVKDHHAPGPEEIGDGGCELSHRHHVEGDVNQSAMLPPRAQDGPPPSVAEDWNGAARSEEEQRAVARREEREQAAGP